MNLAPCCPPMTGFLVGVQIKWVSLASCTCRCQILSKYRVSSSRRCTGQGEEVVQRAGRQIGVQMQGALAIMFLNIEDGN